MTSPKSREAAKPKWWTDTYSKMTSAKERFEYLAGLSDLSWSDSGDAFLEAKKQIPLVAAELAAKDALLAQAVDALDQIENTPYGYADQSRAIAAKALDKLKAAGFGKGGGG